MSLDFRTLLGLEVPKKHIVEPVSVPLAIRFIPETCVWGTRAGRLVHLPSTTIQVALGVLDAWRVRVDFLRVRSPDEMLTFLQGTGVFSQETESGYWVLDDLYRFQTVIGRLTDNEPVEWTHRMFPNQKILRACIRHRHFSVGFSWTSKSHFAELVARSTLEAILASIHVDHLRKAKFWYCERDVCGKQFELTGHRKRYCSDLCAHAEAQKEYRLKKKAQRPTTRKNKRDRPPSD
jgi:hypothetical protein